MGTHPYRELPPWTRWSKAIASVPTAEVDPVVSFPFRIRPQDAVATAGSCFAQNIARHLSRSGYNYLVVEDGHPLASDELKAEYNYGVFSARYANIYTSRQLTQLVRRAYLEFAPIEDHWVLPSGRFIDPLRPQIQPHGFATLQEMHADRAFHLKTVCRMFETLDYFVFTLGLTEFWQDCRDGTAFPLCPGIAGGEFDRSKYEFVNLGVQDVLEDMTWFVNFLTMRNPDAKIILTVSPVPLAATASANTHVLTSTTYSKSVLRVVCEELQAAYPTVAYFPSYEIIAGAYAKSIYYASDLRSVTEDGVDHVMRLFFKHATTDMASGHQLPHMTSDPSSDQFTAEMSRIAQVLCEEELIERSFENHS